MVIHGVRQAYHAMYDINPMNSVGDVVKISEPRNKGHNDL